MKSTFTRQRSITQFNLSSRSYQRLSDPFLQIRGWVVRERRKIIIIKLLSCNVDLMTQNMMQLSDPSEWIKRRCAGRRPAPGDQPFWPTSFTALDRQPGAFLLMPLLPTLKNVTEYVWKKCDAARMKKKEKKEKKSLDWAYSQKTFSQRISCVVLTLSAKESQRQLHSDVYCVASVRISWLFELKDYFRM